MDAIVIESTDYCDYCRFKKERPNGFPCWNCMEGDHFDGLKLYVNDKET